MLRTVAGLLILLLLVFAGPTGYVLLASAGRAGTVAQVPEQPVAIVFGASVYSDGTSSPYLRARLDLAYDLFASGKVRAVLVTGDNGTNTYDETSTMSDYLVARASPRSRWWATTRASTPTTRASGRSRSSASTAPSSPPRATTCPAPSPCAGRWGWTRGASATSSAPPMDPDLWRSYSAREWLANLKAAWDLASRREPTLGQHETGIEQALAAP